MFNYIWPIALVVFSNVIYQICAKSVPEGMNPLASLTITYLVAAAVSGILYFSLSKDPNLIHEYSKTNWVPFAFGFVLVGLEVGPLDKEIHQKELCVKKLQFFFKQWCAIISAIY